MVHLRENLRHTGVMMLRVKSDFSPGLLFHSPLPLLSFSCSPSHSIQVARGPLLPIWSFCPLQHTHTHTPLLPTAGSIPSLGAGSMGTTGLLEEPRVCTCDHGARCCGCGSGRRHESSSMAQWERACQSSKEEGGRFRVGWVLGHSCSYGGFPSGSYLLPKCLYSFLNSTQ